LQTFFSILAAVASLLYVLEYFGLSPKNWKPKESDVQIDPEAAVTRSKDWRFWTVILLLALNLGWSAYEHFGTIKYDAHYALKVSVRSSPLALSRV
jgi:hypothetical protein